MNANKGHEKYGKPMRRRGTAAAPDGVRPRGSSISVAAQGLSLHHLIHLNNVVQGQALPLRFY
ncbi:MAG: hypothetical protein V1738_07000 [Patescibacteria group bacterium]